MAIGFVVQSTGAQTVLIVSRPRDIATFDSQLLVLSVWIFTIPRAEKSNKFYNRNNTTNYIASHNTNAILLSQGSLGIFGTGREALTKFLRGRPDPRNPLRMDLSRKRITITELAIAPKSRGVEIETVARLKRLGLIQYPVALAPTGN